MPAKPMAHQVRPGICCLINILANNAVSNGPSAMMTSRFATVVSQSATIKAVNITAQQRLESHKALPAFRHCRHKGKNPPRIFGKINNKAKAQKKLRQKVTSKPLAEPSWRDTTPAVDHKKATSTISSTARRWFNVK